MLFVTNRTPRQSARSRVNRKISFNYQNTAVSQFLYFCERKSPGEYVEILSRNFFARLKSDLPPETQLLLYIHGFNCNMEPDVFAEATALQQLMDQNSPGLVHVVPLIWPCDDDSAMAFADDYWDDQDAADASAPAFTRLVGKFDDWRRARPQQEEPCLRRINILAHSMGNRVLQKTLRHWAQNHTIGGAPQLFRNVFMIASDTENESLEKGRDGEHIVESSRNVLVYYANDDLAMPASKVANIRNKALSRRLGMTGPADIEKLPKKVYEIDCDDFNGMFDWRGHNYFLQDKSGLISPIIGHMKQAISTGRVSPAQRSTVLT